jgi:hypothetical protein
MYDHKICMLHYTILHHEQWKNTLKIVIMKYVITLCIFIPWTMKKRPLKIVTLKFYIMKIVMQIF